MVTDQGLGGRKACYLLRHAQSTFNINYDRVEIDPIDFDARLSVAGHHQVAMARSQVSGLKLDLVVTSPLTRAIETAVALFAGSVPILVEPLHAEWQINSCDVGRPASILAVEFPVLRFDRLPERWWYQGRSDQRGVAVEPKGDFLARVTAFRTWLSSREESQILVVGHGTFFAYLAGVQLENCQLLHWRPDERAD